MAQEDNLDYKVKISKKTFKRMLVYAKPYVLLFLLAILCITALIGLSLYQPKLLGEATDIISNNIGNCTTPVINSLLMVAVKYAVCVLLTFVINYVQSLLLAYIGQKIIYGVRIDIFRHLHTLDISFFNNNHIGRLVTRATNDVETLSEMYTSVLTTLLQSIGMLVGIIVVMLTINVKLSLITFTVLPLIILITVVFTIISKRNYRKIRAKISSINAFVAEHLSGMKVVQLFTVEDKMQRQFEQRSEDLKRSHIVQTVIFSGYGPTIYLINMCTLIMLVYFGGGMYIEGYISISVIVMFQRYIGRFFDPIQEFAEQLNVIQSASTSAERIFGLLDEKPAIVDSPNAIELGDVKGKIEFRNVWFAYEKDEWILKDVSFVVQPGQSVAFVGATGAGKTTIQNLICRYFDIQKGQILLDDIDINDIKIDSLRIKIGQMLQDVFLFTGNIESNIKLRDDGITQDEVIASAKYVNADSFISKLSQQYNEPVTEGGTSLSAGQRQLLSFARTLAYKPNVLILDEATANIDTETEILIQDALHKIMQGRTTLIVAHRLSTIQNCDNILVMHKGKIVEQGTHQRLLSQKGLYYKLYKLQYEHSDC
ncbi:MAG: ABC transporter ATP-binding protein [Clostridia bacterium]|nr:ABC transporter ATP-binding protein [Clostridia bacterium]